MLNDSINRFLGVLCYPFTCLDYLHEDLLDNYFKLDKTKYNDVKTLKDKIKKNLVHYIMQNYSIYSYDEIYLYLEKCYLYDRSMDTSKNFSDSFECYLDVFHNLAKSLISQRNGKLVFKYWENENDKKLLGGFSGNNKILLFNSFNRHIPLDIIAITYLIQNNAKKTDCLNDFYGQIVVSDLQLDNVLSKGVAENHLHSGVSRSFLSIWESLMIPFTKKSIDGFKKLDLSNNFEYESTEVKFYILVSAILRVIISINVKANKDVFYNENEEMKSNRKAEELYELIIAFINSKDIKKIYKRITSKDKNEIYPYFIKVWGQLFSTYNVEYEIQDNIIFNIFNQDTRLKTSGENIFLFNTIKYIEENINYCDNIKKLFIQYLRIKNFIFNITVQQKTIKGLDYFQMKHYARNSALNKVNNKKFWEIAMREQFQDNNLKKIEFRRSIDENYSKFKKNIKDFLNSYYDILISDYCIEKENGEHIPYRDFPKVGLVYHLLKREDRTSPNKCYYDGEYDEDKRQFESIKNQYRILIENLKSIRREDSELSKYIVGLDAASLENSTPVWVFSEIYEMARDSSVEPLVINDNNALNYYQSLGFTFHAGEDFRHILSGLRRIDEAVKHLKFHAGDRIGHGIALGISAEAWKLHNNTIIIPRIEALENYLWAYNLLSQNYGNFKATTLAYLEKKIYDLSKSIYDSTEGLSTSVLIDGYLRLFDNNHNNVCKDANLEQFCEKVRNDRPMTWNSDKLFFARHCKYYLLKMNEPIHFAVTDQDVDIIKELQKIVKANISRAGIVVEVNPSSNTVLSDNDTVAQNQVYNVNNFRYDANNVIVCINSDDPSVFNTNISNELAYIYYGILEKNVSKEDALNWIERLRKNGIDSSFIKRQESDEQILRNLKRLIDKL